MLLAPLSTVPMLVVLTLAHLLVVEVVVPPLLVAVAVLVVGGAGDAHAPPRRPRRHRGRARVGSRTGAVAGGDEGLGHRPGRGRLAGARAARADRSTHGAAALSGRNRAGRARVVRLAARARLGVPSGRAGRQRKWSRSAGGRHRLLDPSDDGGRAGARGLRGALRRPRTGVVARGRCSWRWRWRPPRSSYAGARLGWAGSPETCSGHRSSWRSRRVLQPESSCWLSVPHPKSLDAPPTLHAHRCPSRRVSAGRRWVCPRRDVHQRRPGVACGHDRAGGRAAVESVAGRRCPGGSRRTWTSRSGSSRPLCRCRLW